MGFDGIPQESTLFGEKYGRERGGSAERGSGACHTRLHRDPACFAFCCQCAANSSGQPHELNGALERFLTVRQVATQLGFCTATVYKWAGTGVSPHSAS